MVDHLERLRSLDPSDSMKETLEAVDEVVKAVKRSEEESFVSEALSLVRQKEEKAYRYYLRPLDSDELYNSLIDVHMERGETEMVKRYNRRLDLRQARKWTILGDCYALMGINKRAVTYLKRALFFGPHEDLLAEVKQTLSRAEKRVDKASSEVEPLLVKLEGNKDDLKLLVKVTAHLLDLDRCDEASKLVMRGLKSSPKDLELTYRKGCISFAKGDFKSSLRTFQELLEKNPKSNNYKRAFNLSEEMIKGIV